MNNINQKKFDKFKEGVLEYSTISIDELYMILNRVTWSDKKQYFGFNKDQQFKARLRYHRHWIKMLEGQGIIEQIPEHIQRWKVNGRIVAPKSSK